MCSAHNIDSLIVQNQYKIRRKARDTDTIYTPEMLNRNMVITKAIKGIDPDILQSDMETRIGRFKEKRPEMSEEFRQGRAARMKERRKSF